jgi:hypothetical protein
MDYPTLNCFAQNFKWTQVYSSLYVFNCKTSESDEYMVKTC